MSISPAFPARLPMLAAAFAASIALAATAAPASGQTPDSNVERAIELEAQAESHLERADRASRAAGLYRRAAKFRDDADPKKVENLLMAARLSYYAGRERRAMADADAAARLAVRQGHVVAAGHAYLDAASIAVGVGEHERATRYVEEARLLMASPLLAEADRAAIEARILG